MIHLRVCSRAPLSARCVAAGDDGDGEHNGLRAHPAQVGGAAPRAARGRAAAPRLLAARLSAAPTRRGDRRYIDCIAAGRTPEECDKGFPWCEIKEYFANRAFPNLTGILETLNPFGEDCGTGECLQCCYVPKNNGCHSSYIGENVINCRANIYGEGTRGVGLTLLLAELPEEGTCLFTPQVCAHIGLCLQGSAAATASRIAAPEAGLVDYLTDPRAVKQRARVFANYALTHARRYLNEYATDTPDALPLQSLNDAVFGRGWATWRQDMVAFNIDLNYLNDPLFRIDDSAGNMIETASRANAARIFALLRLLTSVPNLAGRLAYIESRVWKAEDKASHLAAIPNPDAALQETVDPHIVGILKRVPSLQDYQLFAAPLAGEASTTGRFGGMLMGTPPTLRLSATSVGLTATLTATLEDPTDAVGLPRPLSVDWGDGA
ncbi:MAG: hypothetical protein HC853_09420 [Anaerolineae bacterium]|nr:hypothetical protein [Anaerolineae bacterium]